MNKKTYIAPSIERVYSVSTEHLCIASPNRMEDPDTGDHILTDRNDQEGNAGDAWSKEDWGNVGGIWED